MTPRQRSPSAAHLREQARENQSLLDTVLVGIVFVRQRVVLRCNRHLAAGQREGVCACGCGQAQRCLFSRAGPAGAGAGGSALGDGSAAMNRLGADNSGAWPASVPC